MDQAEAKYERDPACVEAWPECESGGYDPRCCRFPKSCSCMIPAGLDVPGSRTGMKFAPRDASWWRRPRRKGVYTVHAMKENGMAACADSWSGIALDGQSAAPLSFWNPGQVCRRSACQRAAGDVQETEKP